MVRSAGMAQLYAAWSAPGLESNLCPTMGHLKSPGEGEGSPQNSPKALSTTFSTSSWSGLSPLSISLSTFISADSNSGARAMRRGSLLGFPGAYVNSGKREMSSRAND